MTYPHYRGTAFVYDKLDRGGVDTIYAITEAIRRSETDFALDLETEANGTKIAFTLSSQDGRRFTGQGGDVTVEVNILFSEDGEEVAFAGKWRTAQEEWFWRGELSRVNI